MSEERRITVEEQMKMKTIKQQNRLANRAVIITTVFAAAALALFTLAWTGRCPLKVDMDAAGARALVQRYSVQFVPTILLVDSRGEDLDRVGYVGAGEFIEFVNDAR
ncbi:MAG: hypothetical protein WD049_02025 [Candidatus Paceibacterota bacterium]